MILGSMINRETGQEDKIRELRGAKLIILPLIILQISSG